MGWILLSRAAPKAAKGRNQNFNIEIPKAFRLESWKARKLKAQRRQQASTHLNHPNAPNAPVHLDLTRKT
jgi:hypothetical protein